MTEMPQTTQTPPPEHLGWEQQPDGTLAELTGDPDVAAWEQWCEQRRLELASPPDEIP